MKKSVFVISLCLGILASRAFAAEVSIKGNINQHYDASDNYFLVQSPKGYTVKSTTSGTLNFLAQTPTTSYLLNTYASYFKYLGPGADDAGSLTSGTPASTTFSINHIATELTAFNFNASMEPRRCRHDEFGANRRGHRQRLNQYLHRWGGHNP